MTPRERALAVYDFKQTDIPCFDLMEGTFWPELSDDFISKYGMSDPEQIQTALGCDFRWTIFRTRYNPGWENEPVSNEVTFSDDTGSRILKSAETPADVRRLLPLDANLVQLPDFKKFRNTYPDKALICCPGWMPSFSGACEDFGMVQALSLMALEPEIINEYVQIKKEYALEVIRKAISAGVAKYCDFLWLGDDFAGEATMLLSPSMWREMFKPALKEQVQEARNAGLKVMFHSCGYVAPVYEDFIEIGINAHIGVQTSCPDMSAEELAEKIGGRLVIHGGVDAQKTLVEGDFDHVVEQTQRNIKAFSKCGGYVVSNSHHGMPDIGAEKIVAMSVGAGRWDFNTGYHGDKKI
ncbi:MAG TPA: hypothetical protein DDZ89_02895 [Clostridiales bacterium]|nr:hypothetical protein [Clostridiales bacterium]